MTLSSSPTPKPKSLDFASAARSAVIIWIFWFKAKRRFPERLRPKEERKKKKSYFLSVSSSIRRPLSSEVPTLSQSAQCTNPAAPVTHIHSELNGLWKKTEVYSRNIKVKHSQNSQTDGVFKWRSSSSVGCSDKHDWYGGRITLLRREKRCSQAT